MNLRRGRTLSAVALTAALLLSACVPNRAWRIHYSPGRPPAIDPPLFAVESTADCRDAPAPLNKPSAYRLAFVEFDDRGELFERGQLQQALRTIKEVQGRASASHPAAVVLFVHGWQNNASDRTGNVAGFKKMLTCLGPQYNPADAKPEDTRVLGIYIGWRGLLVDAPVARYLTFWNRRNESQTLPGAHVVETLLSIMKAAKGADFSGPGVSILIGHSFGGSLLETALTQTYENIVLDTPSGQPIHWPTDLTVLINEAAPASQSYQFIESMNANVVLRPPCGPGLPPRDKTDFYMPAIISMTSEGDTATGKFFPLGQKVSRPFHSLRKYPHPNELGVEDQAAMYEKTTALSSAFLSHTIDTDASTAVKAAVAAGCRTALVSDVAGGRYRLIERPGAKNLSPYWVMQLPTKIVPDHSTVFGSEFRSVLIDLVQVRHLLEPTPYIRK